MATEREQTPKNDLPDERTVATDFSIPEDADYLPAADDESRREAEGKG